MKKWMTLVTLFALAMFVVGCAPETTEPGPVTPSTDNSADVDGDGEVEVDEADVKVESDGDVEIDEADVKVEGEADGPVIDAPEGE